MNKKAIITISILTLTAVLAGVAVFTALELQKNRQSNSPTAPESNPSASESVQTAISCEPLLLSIGKIALASPTASPIATGIPTPTPSATATPTASAKATSTPKATSTATASATSTPELPDAGTATPTVVTMALGILLLLIAASLAI